MSLRNIVEIFFLCLAIIPPVMVILYRTGPVPWGTLRYGVAMRLFALFFAVCVLAFVVGSTASAINAPTTEVDQWAWPLLALAVFAPLAGWLTGDALFVRHRFDAVGIYYRSPRSAHRQVNAFAKAALAELPASVKLRHPREMKVLEALREGRAVQLTGMGRL